MKKQFLFVILISLIWEVWCPIIYYFFKSIKKKTLISRPFSGRFLENLPIKIKNNSNSLKETGTPWTLYSPNY